MIRPPAVRRADSRHGRAVALCDAEECLTCRYPVDDHITGYAAARRDDQPLPDVNKSARQSVCRLNSLYGRAISLRDAEECLATLNHMDDVLSLRVSRGRIGAMRGCRRRAEQCDRNHDHYNGQPYINLRPLHDRFSPWITLLLLLFSL